jgi:PAS domain S-box-containing protein
VRYLYETSLISGWGSVSARIQCGGALHSRVMGQGGSWGKEAVPRELSGELHRAGLRYAPVGVAHLALDGKWLWVNERLCELLGYSEAELRDFDFQRITHPEDLELDLAQVEALINGEIERYSMEKRYLRKDGEILWAKLSVTLLRDPLGEPLQFVSFIDDITRERLLAEELRQTSAELATRNQALQEYTQTLAHELRAPFRILAGYVDMLPEVIDGPREEFDRVVGVIASNAKRMRDMVEALLRLAEYGYRALEVVEIDMTRLVREAFDFHSLGLEDRVVAFQVGELPNVHADGALLRHVWDNLISNALKYTKGQPRPRVEVEGSEAGDFVTYSIRDNGVGFEQRYARHIFRPFQRVCDNNFEGLGIGLALVERILQRHGGYIEAHSNLGVGTTFVFRLPRLQLSRSSLGATNAPQW